MTERLKELLHDEASALDVPAPDSGAVLSTGRGLRRRRRAATWGAGLAVLAVIGGAAVTASSLGGDDSAKDNTPAAAQPATGAVFSVGTTVYLDDGATKATIDDKSIKSLYYTSAGVLVRHGNNPNSDGGGPQRFSLVTPDGTVQPISVVTEETVASTDPDQPYLAYAETIDGHTSVVVWDLRDDSEAARVPLPDGLHWGGWPAPPVALSGDLVYVGADDVQRAVNWRTGDVEEITTIGPGYPDVFGGRAVVSTDNKSSIIDVASGETLVGPEKGYFRLAPDGRYALMSDFMSDDPKTTIFDVATGAHVVLDGPDYGFGWSADDRLFSVDGNQLTTCDPDTGTCTTQPVDLVTPPGEAESFDDDLKLGGVTYES